jgi:hypothetical protein
VSGPGAFMSGRTRTWCAIWLVPRESDGQKMDARFVQIASNRLLAIGINKREHSYTEYHNLSPETSKQDREESELHDDAPKRATTHRDRFCFYMHFFIKGFSYIRVLSITSSLCIARRHTTITVQ